MSTIVCSCGALTSSYFALGFFFFKFYMELYNPAKEGGGAFVVLFIFFLSSRGLSSARDRLRRRLIAQEG